MSTTVPSTIHQELLNRLLVTWGDNVREARRERGLTQGELATAAGLAQQSLSKIERGETCLHDRHKLALSFVLGAHPSRLFAWP